MQTAFYPAQLQSSWLGLPEVAGAGCPRTGSPADVIVTCAARAVVPYPPTQSTYPFTCFVLHRIFTAPFTVQSFPNAPLFRSISDTRLDAFRRNVPEPGAHQAARNACRCYRVG
jgi:hypothetical protein